VEDWAEIRRLHRSEGLPVKAIARRLEVARNTVRSAWAVDEPPRYARPLGGSKVDVFVPAIRELLTQFPDMPVSRPTSSGQWPQVGVGNRDRRRKCLPRG
jgi:transposase